MAKLSPTTSFGLLSKSIDAVRKNIFIFVVLVLLPNIVRLFGGSSQSSQDQAKSSQDFHHLFGGNYRPTTSIVIIVLVGLFFGMLLAGAYQTFVVVLELESAKGKKLSFSALLNTGVKYIYRMIGLMTIVVVMFIVGMVLFIIPGLLVLRRYLLAPYAMIDKNLSIREAMRYSASISKPYAGSVWGVIGVTLLFGLVGILPLVGVWLSVALTTCYSVAPAIRYLELKQLS